MNDGKLLLKLEGIKTKLEQKMATDPEAATSYNRGKLAKILVDIEKINKAAP